MKTIKQIINFKTQPHDIFESLMDSKKHSAFTSSKCSIKRKVGQAFSAYDNYATGKNLQIVKDKKIVQTWRASDWPDKIYSKITFTLTKTKTGTKLAFTQQGVPDNQYKSISKGWYDFYWNPMKIYLEK